MTIKNFFKLAFCLIFITFTFNAQTSAASKIITPVENRDDARLLSNIVSRVTEIQNMDKSNLTTSEKKALTKELKEMKRKADGFDKRVYLSVGAIIIIILILILILK